MPDAEDAHDLYGLRPEEFTAARDALARRLRAAKQRDRADEVKRLRRPSTIAWALNQVARTRADAIEAVLSAGQDVKGALDRGDGAAMREAERSMREASDVVVDAASGVWRDSGAAPDDDARARMATTLRAAVIDPAVADRVRSGTLDRDVEVAGFGLGDVAVGGTRPTPPAAPRPRAGADENGRDQKRQEQEERAERRRQDDERRRRDEARRVARARVAGLDSKAERLSARARRLADLADRAQEAARRARAEADDARAEATEAAEQASAARAEAAADE